MPTTRPYWGLAIAGAAILAVTMGIRQSLGLFVSPLNTSTGLGIVTVSFALAVGQFVWGAAQPVFGIIADRVGPVRVMMAGGALLRPGPRGHAVHGFRLRPRLLPRRRGGGRRGRGQLLDPLRRGRQPHPRGEARLRLRVHQRRRLVRAVRLRAPVAGAHRRAGLGGRALGARRRRARDAAHGARLPQSATARRRTATRPRG